MAHRPLVAYFSREGETYVGNSVRTISQGPTAVLAKRVSRLINGRLLAIEPLDPYPAAYKECLDRARRELRDDILPELKPVTIRFSVYETVILGFPNWWKTMPKPMFTFLRTFDTRGKRIAPFCTHEGTGFGDSLRHLRMLCPEAEILPGLAVAARDLESPETGQALTTWLAEVRGNE